MHCKIKAANETLNVTFLQHDIAALDELDDLKEGYFDVISCASAFVLFEDHRNVIKGWVKLLNGSVKLIFDVPARNSMIGGWVLNVIGHNLRMPIAYDRTRLDSAEKIKALLREAGLNGSDTFLSESYGDKELDIENAGVIFENIVGRQNWFEDVYADFKDPAKKPLAKKMFCQEMKKLADKDGKVKEEMRFIMAVGKKL